eukprot:scaffold14762_cov193-Alexandrium_tamarense.AAC.2
MSPVVDPSAGISTTPCRTSAPREDLDAVVLVLPASDDTNTQTEPVATKSMANSANIWVNRFDWRFLGAGVTILVRCRRAGGTLGGVSKRRNGGGSISSTWNHPKTQELWPQALSIVTRPTLLMRLPIN